MTQQLQTVLEAAHALSPLEQLELIQELSHSLQQNYPFTLNAAAFWRPRSLEEIAQDYPVPVVTDIRPSDESADDIISFITEKRRADRLRGV